MSVILEALKRAKKAKTDNVEGDSGFKIATILSPVNVAEKRRLSLFKILSLVGIGGGLIFFLVTVLLLSPKTPVREEVRYNGQENLETPKIVKSDTGSEPRKAPPVMELQKPEPLNDPVRETSSPLKIARKETPVQKIPQPEPLNDPVRERSFPLKIARKGTPVQKIPQKEIRGKSKSPKGKLGLKRYVKIPPPAEESFAKEDTKKDGPPKQIPVELNPPQSDSYHFNLGVFYQGEGKLKDAKEEYEKVLSLAPSHVEAHNNLGVVYKDLGRLEMAIAEYRKAITLDSQYKKARSNLATALYLKGDLESATSESRLAIVFDPNDLEVYNILGLIYKKQNKTQEAIEVFRKALAIDPGHPPTHYNLAMMLEKFENLPEAMFHYQKFVDLSRARGDNSVLVGKVVKHLTRLSSP